MFKKLHIVVLFSYIFIICFICMTDNVCCAQNKFFQNADNQGVRSTTGGGD